jgi:hypothetical protein
MVNRMAKRIEYEGYKTLCFMPTWVSSFYKYLDETVVTNKVKAEFSHRHAAAAVAAPGDARARLGEVGVDTAV